MLAASFPARTAADILAGRLGESRRHWGPSPEHEADGWLLLVSGGMALGCAMTHFGRPELVLLEDGTVDQPGPWTWIYSDPRPLDEPIPWAEVPQVMLGLAVVTGAILDDLEALLGVCGGAPEDGAPLVLERLGRPCPAAVAVAAEVGDDLPF